LDLLHLHGLQAHPAIAACQSMQLGLKLTPSVIRQNNHRNQMVLNLIEAKKPNGWNHPQVISPQAPEAEC
jgi:hypothetical protein